MKNSNYKINAHNISIAILKIAFVGLILCAFSHFWHDKLYTPIMPGKSESTPMNLLIVGVFLFITAQIVNLLRNCVWDYYLPKKRNVRISKLLIGIINFCIYLICIFIACSVILQLNVSSALAATGALGMVLGFGLQKIFQDLFVGISLDMDKSFRIGDFIHLKSGGADIVGEVIQMSWRVVSVKAPENAIHQIPNGVFGTTIVTNLSRPTPESEFELTYCVPFQYNENNVMKAITNGLDAVACMGSITDPKCRISKTTADGVVYKVKYIVNPTKCGPGKAKHLIHSRVFRFLRAANIALANSDQRVYMTNVEEKVVNIERETATCIAKIDLFQTLTEAQVNDIAAGTTIRNFNKGDAICTQGEEGSSLFIVRDGYLKVFITNDAGAQQQVAVLIPEDFFGEMSLLTGDKRSATVTAASQVILYEISAVTLAPLFESNDKFPQILSKIITERNASNSALTKTPEEEVAQISKLRELEMRIKNFSKKLFGLKG